MALFPKIDSPCPYKENLSEIMDGDVCRMCEREVFDLTHMSDLDRKLFMNSCSGQVCVSYSVPMRRAVTAAAVTAAGVLASHSAAAQEDLYCYTDIIVGGVDKGNAAKFIDLTADLDIPELPVIFGDTPMPVVDEEIVQEAEVLSAAKAAAPYVAPGATAPEKAELEIAMKDEEAPDSDIPRIVIINREDMEPAP